MASYFPEAFDLDNEATVQALDVKELELLAQCPSWRFISSADSAAE